MATATILELIPVKVVPAPGSPDHRRRCPFSPPLAYEVLRASGDTGFVTKESGAAGWLLTSFADIHEVLGDSKRFSSRVNAAPPMLDGRETPAWFFGMDAAEHARYRGVLTRTFTLRAMRRWAPNIEEIVSGRLDAMAAKAGTADIFEDLAWPVPGLVICELLGIDHKDQPGFEAQVAVFDRRDVSEEELDQTWYDMWHAMLDLARRKQAKPGDDLLSQLLHPKPADMALSAEECASTALALRLAGQAPVSHVLAMGVFLLLQDRANITRMLEGPEQLAAAVEELLRYLPTNNLGVVRAAAERTSIAGQVVEGGDLVFVSLPTANRDPLRFPDPDQLNFERPAAGHLAFGHGVHKCVGQNLARVQLQIAFRELFTRFPDLRLAEDPSKIPMYESESSYGVERLPVIW